MHAMVKKKITLDLVLTLEEAEWLRDYLQNWPAGGDEPADSTKMRHALFEVLRTALRQEV